MIKAQYDIEKGIWFKSTEITLQGVAPVLLSRLSLFLVNKKNRKTRRNVLVCINMFGYAVELLRVLDSGEKYKSTPFIWDTGASFVLTPFRSDFIDYDESDIPSSSRPASVS